jgi:hypothetical protein
VDTEFAVTCPFCGESVEIYIEPDVTGHLVQACEVCCQPWDVSVHKVDGRRAVSVRRADGTD